MQKAKPQSVKVARLQPSETAILDLVPDAVVIAGIDGAIVFANPQAEKMFGYPPNELHGMGLESLLPERFRKKHRDLRSVYFTTSKIRPMGAGMKLHGMKKDGTQFPVEISLSPFATDGEMLAISTIRDISERRRVEDKLRKNIRELRDFKSALDEHAILAITDPRGRITYANDKFCSISKYSREELLGQDHRIINSGHHPKEFWREVWETIGGGKVWKGEVKNRAKDGSFYWVDATIVPFLDDQGKPLQYVAIRTEITARKRAEEEREKLIEELRGALAEVRTLSGFLPICCKCKKIRDDKGYWNQIEAYVSSHSNAMFSHGYCPDCIKQAYDDAGLSYPGESTGS